MAAKGQVYFEPALASKALARQMTGPSASRETTNAQLSEREKEVLSLIAWGYSNKEAADKLNVSVKTVETYRVRIAEKLGLRSRTRACQIRVAARLVERRGSSGTAATVAPGGDQLNLALRFRFSRVFLFARFCQRNA